MIRFIEIFVDTYLLMNFNPRMIIIAYSDYHRGKVSLLKCCIALTKAGKMYLYISRDFNNMSSLTVLGVHPPRDASISNNMRKTLSTVSSYFYLYSKLASEAEVARVKC